MLFLMILPREGKISGKEANHENCENIILLKSNLVKFIKSLKSGVVGRERERNLKRDGTLYLVIPFLGCHPKEAIKNAERHVCRPTAK